MAKSAAPKSAENTGRRLRAAGLRPTRQRVALASLLFAHGHRHLTAESLHAEVDKAGIDVSLATVYNTLHQFTEAGILRHVSVDASRFYFDTNIDPHQHFYDQASGMLIDIPDGAITIAGVPTPPKDTIIDGVNVVIRIKPTVQAVQALQSAGVSHISVK